jgi:hypothetical protein
MADSPPTAGGDDGGSGVDGESARHPPRRQKTSRSRSLSQLRRLQGGNTTTPKTSRSSTTAAGEGRMSSASASAAVTPALSETKRTATSPATIVAAAAAARKKAAVKKEGGGRGASKKSPTTSTTANNKIDYCDDMVDLTAISSSDDEDDDIQRNMKMPAKWKCPRCTLFNINSASICIACDYNPIEDDNNTWKCSHCTLFNPNTLSECDACGQSSHTAVSSAVAATATATAINDNDAADDDVMDEDQDQDQDASMMGSSSPSTASTKRKKRKKSDGTATSTSTNTNTKRIKSESSIIGKKGDDDDDDVVVSAVVESRTATNRDRRDRRNNNNRKSAPSRIATGGATADADDDDDDVVLEAVVNAMKLPHSREDCIENIFNSIDTTASNNKVFKGSKNTVLSSKKNNDNACDCCYCYVCDSPAKDCKKWYSSSSNSATNNHCCARAKIEPWKSLRAKHKAEVDAKAAAAALAVSAPAPAAAAATAAAGGARGITATTARAPNRFHFMNRCRHYPRGTNSMGVCGKCWCYVCNSEGSSCSNRSSHVNADHTMLIWRQQREMMENKLTIQVQPTFGEKGPFEPDDNSALQDSILDKSLIQCRHCKWFMRFGDYFDDCMVQRMNSITNDDWCLNCGLVASENDLEKDQAGPIPDGNDNNDVKPPPNAAAATATATAPSLSPFLLGTKEIAFAIKSHDPRKMDKYKGNWKEYAKDQGWVYDLAKQKEEVFLHRIGKNPRLKNLLERAAIVSPAHIPTDAPKEDADWRSRGVTATIDDTGTFFL